jgi:hypothetical protein
MPNRLLWRLVLLSFAAALALGGCQQESGGNAPAAAMRELLGRLRHDDIGGFWRSALPATDYLALRASWRHGDARPALSGEQRARFDESLRRLLAPGAKASLNAQWQPRLARAEQQYGDQLPLLIGIGRSLLGQTLAAHYALDPAQQAQAEAMLAALVPWAQRAPWFDPAHAERLADVAVETARGLRLQSVEQALALDFDTAAQKASIAVAGIKRAFAVYGISLDAALDSAHVTTVSQQGDRATVRIDYSLGGQAASAIASMRRIDGRWYSAALVDAVRRGEAGAAAADPVATPAAKP